MVEVEMKQANQGLEPVVEELRDGVEVTLEEVEGILEQLRVYGDSDFILKKLLPIFQRMPVDQLRLIIYSLDCKEYLKTSPREFCRVLLEVWLENTSTDLGSLESIKKDSIIGRMISSRSWESERELRVAGVVDEFNQLPPVLQELVATASPTLVRVLLNNNYAPTGTRAAGFAPLDKDDFKYIDDYDSVHYREHFDVLNKFLDLSLPTQTLALKLEQKKGVKTRGGKEFARFLLGVARDNNLIEDFGEIAQFIRDAKTNPRAYDDSYFVVGQQIIDDYQKLPQEYQLLLRVASPVLARQLLVAEDDRQTRGVEK